MINKIKLKHPLQKHIIDVLTYRESARFSELKLSKTDTNVFSYHLKVLLQADVIKKVGDTYILSQNSFSYIDNLTKYTSSNQPKILCMLLIQNSEGDVLLYKRHKQPYIDRWTLPYSKILLTDGSVLDAGRRVAREKLGLTDQALSHVGDAYIRVQDDKDTLSTTLVHVLRFNKDTIAITDNLQWIQPHKLASARLVPGVEEIIARSFFNDDFFFEEFDVQYVY